MQELLTGSTFQKNFLWGAATSSHQVEGDNHNDWSEWENGFWPRFGLIKIDYEKTLERTIRPSAWEYKEIIEMH